MFCILNFSGFVATYEWSSKAVLSCSIICSSVHPVSDKDFRYVSSLCHLSSVDLNPPCMGLRAFCNISLALKNIRCHSEGPCLAPRMVFFLLRLPGIDSCSCPTPSFFAKIQNISHMSSTQCQFASTKNNRGIAFWKKFRKARTSPYCPCRRSTSSTFRRIHSSLQSYSSPAGKTPCQGGSRTAESIC